MNNELRKSNLPAIGYNVIVQLFTSQDEIEVTPLCNGVSVRNLGDTPATINGVRLLPSLVAGQTGESVQWGGNLGELYKGRLQLSFIAPIGVNPLVEIIQKFYLDETR